MSDIAKQEMMESPANLGSQIPSASLTTSVLAEHGVPTAGIRSISAGSADQKLKTPRSRGRKSLGITILSDGLPESGFVRPFQVHAPGPIPISRSKLYELIKDGRLPVRKFDNVTLIAVTDIRRVILGASDDGL